MNINTYSENDAINIPNTWFKARRNSFLNWRSDFRLSSFSTKSFAILYDSGVFLKKKYILLQENIYRYDDLFLFC